MVEITADLLLRAYCAGYFPMAERGDAETLFWFNPQNRGVLPLDSFHLPRSLARTLRRGEFEIRYDTDFAAVIDGCAAPRPRHPETWINAEIRRLFCELFDRGFAHTVEAWCDGRLVGGLYGVAIGRAFFGESMFSRTPDASKVALVHLVALLRWGAFMLLDTQFTNDHLRRFGCRTVSQREYMRMLELALDGMGRWAPEEADKAMADFQAHLATRSGCR